MRGQGRTRTVGIQIRSGDSRVNPAGYQLSWSEIIFPVALVINHYSSQVDVGTASSVLPFKDAVKSVFHEMSLASIAIPWQTSQAA